MGMFDYIKCEYKLPKGHSAIEFQTKFMPERYLDTYIITKDGRLTLDGKDVLYSGTIFFRGNMLCPGYFKDVRYEAIFNNGKLLKVYEVPNV